MDLQSEVYISKDPLGEIYEKIDLSKNEAINMKYVLKDTSDLSKIYAPYSLSFTFPGTLNNQRIFGFVGNTRVYKTKTDNIFACKVYSNGLLAQTGKLALTEVREEGGIVKSFTANFTTTMLSLAARMGDDLINDLPTSPVQIEWLPNNVWSSIASIKPTSTIGYGLTSKYYVPLISNIRVFQRNPNTDLNLLDNVAYSGLSDPTGNHVLKATELSPAIQFRSIIDLIKKKYNLDVEMPLESTAHYNDLYMYCNASSAQSTTPATFDLLNNFGALTRYTDLNPAQILSPQKYSISGNTTINVFDISKNASADSRYDNSVDLYIRLNNAVSTKGADTVECKFIVELESGGIAFQDTVSLSGTEVVSKITIPDSVFSSGHFKFVIKVQPNTPILWQTSDVWIDYGFYSPPGDLYFLTVYGRWKQESLNNNNVIAMGGTKIDLFKSLPKMKCSDFLNSFFKTFNISVFDASPNDDKLFWLTPQDLLASNKAYSKTVVDYTPYISSVKVQKTVPTAFNYFNFKHLTSKYKSNVDYLAAHGVEFGQAAYPIPKPTQNLNEYKVETGFSILEALPIPGLPDYPTSYGFNSNTPEVLVGGEKRYKPNYDEPTIFFSGGLTTLESFRVVGPSLVREPKYLGFQGTDAFNNLMVKQLKSYIKTTPVHPNGFSLGFSLIQEATVRSLYYDFYKTQTERLLDPNTLQHAFELELPAKELVLNYATTLPGESNIPSGFRLQNEIVLQEQRFSVIDATIDITSGKAKMNLLNFR